MSISCVAPHAQGKSAKDRIFGASEAAQNRIKEIGADKVTNSTIGVMLDNDGNFVVLPTVAKVYHSLSDAELFRYAPITGLPEFLDLVQGACFGQSRPDGCYTAAVATAGGSGAVHHCIWNYTMPGDTVLTSAWYWGPYKTMCRDMNRNFDTYPMVTEDHRFNLEGLREKVQELLKKQDRVLVIINTPAHNPTGFSLTPEDIENVLHMLEDSIKGTNKKAVLALDVAYIDYAGEREEVRKIFKKLSHLPENIFVLICYSLSKSFSMYGQRSGASSVFLPARIRSRNSWTSISLRAAAPGPTATAVPWIRLPPSTRTKKLLDDIQKERNHYYKMIQERGDVFTREAQECGLKMMPYISGFFLSIPAKDSEAVCNKLHEDNIFCVPLAAGVRVGLCCTPLSKIYGMAKKIKKAMDAVGE